MILSILIIKKNDDKWRGNAERLKANICTYCSNEMNADGVSLIQNVPDQVFQIWEFFRL